MTECKIIYCNNSKEFLAEFKKYKDRKNDVINKGNLKDYACLMFDTKKGNKYTLIKSINLTLNNKDLRKGSEIKLVLDLSRISDPIRLSEIEYYERIIGEILVKIWEKGSADTSFLEARLKRRNKLGDTTSLTKLPNKKNWLIGGTIFIFFAFLLVYLFKKAKKVKK